jgi:hypothetical protein
MPSNCSYRCSDFFAISPLIYFLNSTRHLACNLHVPREKYGLPLPQLRRRCSPTVVHAVYSNSLLASYVFRPPSHSVPQTLTISALVIRLNHRSSLRDKMGRMNTVATNVLVTTSVSPPRVCSPQSFPTIPFIHLSTQPPAPVAIEMKPSSPESSLGVLEKVRHLRRHGRVN